MKEYYCPFCNEKLTNFFKNRIPIKLNRNFNNFRSYNYGDTLGICYNCKCAITLKNIKKLRLLNELGHFNTIINSKAGEILE